jgi:exopolyphosphatase / guanosine-5'-triphosphate,3'-diphosphate pyrophosphatase
MKLAVIDCGTNTFNLIVIELREYKQYTKLFHTRIPVKLGEAAINEGFIAEAPFKRGIDAIIAFREEIKKFGEVRVLAVATSAIRDASNGEKFVKEINVLLNTNVQVIDGDREAELIYLGVKEAVKLHGNVSLIMDIGGGSTEFLLASNDKIFWKQSFKIGAARLLERFKHSDPITEKEEQEINDYLKEQLAPLFEAAKKFAPLELVGSSGAFESFIEMINGELNGEPFTGSKTEYGLNKDDYKRISQLVKSSTLEERKKIKGLVPMRFDMIVICCLMVDTVLDSLKLNKIRVSTYSLKEGALLDHINTH